MVGDDIVPEGRWTTYGEIAEVVYGHRRGGAQTVGNVIHSGGDIKSAHRTLRAGGKIAPLWQGVGGGPEESRRRLEKEGSWDGRRDRARADRFIDAQGLRRQLKAAGP
jgi:alkylated DNA nucleotide flippase Atl1